MKAIMVMFDSLNRHCLPPYGCDWVHAPNFARLASKALTFDTSYVASMPCMPARRDLHTGRPNFLHRGWGPLEPFDESFVNRLRQTGTYTHLCSDHYHYWEAGGATYHTQYNSWEFFRGQEGDPWVGQVQEPSVPHHINGKGRRQDWVNRQYMQLEKDQPQPQTMAAGLNFIERNAAQDNWFLQIECFDPHEPFFSPQSYQDLYPESYDGPLFDWPGYHPVTETPEQVEHVRNRYAALLSMCDRYLGEVLDAMDEHNLWQDTMLIVWTDHGFLLGEHNCWAKNWPPLYEEISHTPFFLHDPRHNVGGERRSALVQPALDLAPTLLDFFGLERGPHMTGCDLGPVIANDSPVREAALFGFFGNRVNVTDGHDVLYEVAPHPEVPLYEYTLMPTGMREALDLARLQQATLAAPMPWSRGCKLLQIPFKSNPSREADGQVRSLCFDLKVDPGQSQPVQDPAKLAHLRSQMASLLELHGAPPERYLSLGLHPPK